MWYNLCLLWALDLRDFTKAIRVEFLLILCVRYSSWYRVCVWSPWDNKRPLLNVCFLLLSWFFSDEVVVVGIDSLLFTWLYTSVHHSVTDKSAEQKMFALFGESQNRFVTQKTTHLLETPLIIKKITFLSDFLNIESKQEWKTD